MSEVRDRPSGEEEQGLRPGSRRSIYLLEPPQAMVDRAVAAYDSVVTLAAHSEGMRTALRAVLNPAVEHMGCGSSLVSWHRDTQTKQTLVDSTQRCPLDSDHHGSHITPDGLHVWDDPDDEDEW